MIESINLNLIPSGVSPVCHVSQYDAGRQIKINLFEGINPYTIQSGDAFTLNVRKPDNTIVTTSVSGTQGNNYIIIATTEQIAAVVGENLCELKITNGSTVIGTLNFIMQVERDVLADGVPSQSVIEDLDERIAEAIGDNYYNKTETDALLNEKANANSVYTKTETDNLLDKKADIDGVYEDLTAGNAEALLTDKYQEDKTPYNFRKSGGALTVGSREVDELIGGTLAFNQLAVFSQNQIPSNNKGITYAYTDGTSVKCNGTATADETRSGWFGLSESSGFKNNIGHRVIIITKVISGTASTDVYFGWSTTPDKIGSSIISTVPSGTQRRFYYKIPSGTTCTDYVFTINCIDLTQMFGATIADYIYSLEQGTAGAGVAWFRALFPNPYYAYNAGELMSVKTSKHITIGKNLVETTLSLATIDNSGTISSSSGATVFDMHVARVIKDKTYTIKSDESVNVNQQFVGGFFYDMPQIGSVSYNGARLANTPATFTAPIDGYVAFRTSHNYAIAQCEFGSTQTQYEPYIKHEYPLDANLELRGIAKLDANNNLYYYGDEYTSDGNVKRRFAIVDLGSLDWTRKTDGTIPYFRHDFTDSALTQINRNFICFKYENVVFSDIYTSGKDKACASYSGGVFIISDTTYNDAIAFKTAMSGVFLVYELATATSEDAIPYQNPQVVDTYGTEEYIDNRAVAMPVGHNTKYLWDLKQKVEQLYGIPEAPTTNGNYKLVCTVSSGTPSYSWVLDT